jgi:hypothetical protein
MIVQLQLEMNYGPQRKQLRQLWSQPNHNTSNLCHNVMLLKQSSTTSCI